MDRHGGTSWLMVKDTRSELQGGEGYTRECTRARGGAGPCHAPMRGAHTRPMRLPGKMGTAAQPLRPAEGACCQHTGKLVY